LKPKSYFRSFPHHTVKVTLPSARGVQGTAPASSPLLRLIEEAAETLIRIANAVKRMGLDVVIEGVQRYGLKVSESKA
jgi:hypothetical protein